VGHSKKAKPRKHNNCYNNLGERGHQDPPIKSQLSSLNNHPKHRSTSNLRNIQKMAQSKTKSGGINDLSRKPFQPSCYLWARIEEPTTSWPIEEFFSLKEKNEFKAKV
jgi:hypothetical protein